MNGGIPIVELISTSQSARHGFASHRGRHAPRMRAIRADGARDPRYPAAYNAILPVICPAVATTTNAAIMPGDEAVVVNESSTSSALIQGMTALATVSTKQAAQVSNISLLS
jgi:hypothetical protein